MSDRGYVEMPSLWLFALCFLSVFILGGIVSLIFIAPLPASVSPDVWVEHGCAHYD